MNTNGREDCTTSIQQDLAKATHSLSLLSTSAGAVAELTISEATGAEATAEAAESPSHTSDLASPLADLPPELVDVILDNVPPEDQQRTALALRRVLPHHPVSNAHLWNHLIVHQPRQLRPLYFKLKEEAGREGGGATKVVKTFAQVSRVGASHPSFLPPSLHRRPRTRRSAS
jgi:hypothetical protein